MDGTFRYLRPMDIMYVVKKHSSFLKYLLILMENIIGLNKKPEIKKKKELQVYNISWQTYRNVSIGIIFVSIFLVTYIVNISSKQINDKYLLTIINIISIFFIFNLCIFLFYKTYYQYIITKKGEKGINGQRGKKGLQGVNAHCDISTKKTSNFKREKIMIKKEIIEKEDNTQIDFSKMKSKLEDFSIINETLTNTMIGNSCSNCNDLSIDGYISENNKPIIGAVVNYNKNTNKILAIQYLYDKNKIHNKENYLIGNFGGTKKGIIGDSKNLSKNVERTDFTCPENSAIYKVEGMYDDIGLRGLKFHCQDLKTGKLVKAYNNNNRKVYGVTFGLNPKPDNENYKYDKVECKISDYIPTFISEIGGEYDKLKSNIQNLKFNKCVKLN